jgi:hypothetical protein
VKYKYPRQIEKFKRRLLNKLLDKCTKKQREFFWNLFEYNISTNQLETAIALCERTLAKSKNKH